MLALGLLMGGPTACGDAGDDGATSGTTTAEGAADAANGLAEPLAAVPDPTTLEPEVAAALEECMITAAEAGLQG